MGPLDSSACGPFFKSERIGISFPLTCINAIRAIYEYVIYYIIIFWSEVEYSIQAILFLIASIFVGVILPLILLWFVKRCCKCCCHDCCSKHCCPLTKISYLDPNAMDELKFIDQQNHEEDIEIATVSWLLFLVLKFWCVKLIYAYLK